MAMQVNPEESPVPESTPAPTVRLIRSNRGNNQLCIDGYIFSKNKSTTEKQYWECEQRKHTKNGGACRAKAITTSIETLTLQSAHCSTLHNHAPRAELSHVKTARSDIKAAAGITMNKPCQIIQLQQAAAGPSSIAISPSMPNKQALRKVISRVRKSGKPKEPKKLDEIQVPDELRNTLSGELFLQREIDFGDDKVLLFTTVEDLRQLEKCSYWMADGTFKTAPKMFMQLFSIHGFVGGVCGTIQPLVYALMTRRTNACYDHVMRALTEISAAHNIVLNPKVVLTDFEPAEMKSFVREFPNARSKGCLFHLGQSIYRRIHSLGLSQRYGNDVEFGLLLRQLFALAYLHEDEIESAFFEIKPSFPAETEQLIEWFESTYVLGRKRRRSQSSRSEPLFPPTVWSVHSSVVGNIPRTQNKIESWHNRWRHLVGDCPGVYALISYFRDEENKVRCELQRSLAGIQQHQDKNQLRREENIKRIVADRPNKTTIDFLKGMAYNLSF